MRMSYESHYKSKRPDGRHTSSMAAHMAWLRDREPELALPEQLTKQGFDEWKIKVREKAEEEREI